MEAPSKAFLLFFLLPDWLKLNHLWSWVEYGFSEIFSLHICSTVAETISVTNNTACFGAKNVQIFEAAEMMLGPWNQQICLSPPNMNCQSVWDNNTQRFDIQRLHFGQNFPSKKSLGHPGISRVCNLETPTRTVSTQCSSFKWLSKEPDSLSFWCWKAAIY